MKKENMLYAIGAVVILLGVGAGIIFGSDAPRRVTITGFGGGYDVINYEMTESVRTNLGRSPYVPFSSWKDVDVVIHGDPMFEAGQYHEGDRLTSENGKLVKQSWYRIARNDVRYLAYRARKKITGKD